VHGRSICILVNLVVILLELFEIIPVVSRRYAMYCNYAYIVELSTMDYCNWTNYIKDILSDDYKPVTGLIT
jgi:hypothetical protein